MSLPVASLLSPNRNEILVYRITEKLQVGISRASFDPKNPDIFRYRDRPGPKAGQLQRPSAISAVYLNDLPVIYGSVEILVDETKTPPIKASIVAQISPQLYSITDQANLPSITLPTDNLSLTAVSDGVEQVWLSYFQQGKSDGPLSLVEASISGNDLPEVKVPDTNIVPYAKSRLAGGYVRAATNDDSGRIVFYQKTVDDDNNPIYALLQFTGDSTNISDKLPSTENALQATPLTAVVVGESPNHSIYLYFLNSSVRISRSVYKKGKWNPAEEVKTVNKDATLPLKETGLTAVAGEKFISLFYVMKKSTAKEYSFFLDPYEYKS